MNHAFTPLAEPPPLTNNAQVALWQQFLSQSPNSLVGFEAVRDQTGAVQNLRYLFLNKAGYAAVFHLMPNQEHDVTGELITDYFPSVRQTTLWPVYLSVLETGNTQRIEQHYTHDGRDLWISQTVSLFAADTLLLQENDVTGHHRTARQLSYQTALFANVLKTIPNGLIISEAVRDDNGQLLDLRYLEISQSVLNDLGQPREAVIGRGMCEILVGLSASAIWQVYETVLATGITQRFENQYRLNDQEHWFDLSVSKLNDGLVVSYTNITAAKQIQQQLETTVRELSRSNDNLQQFAYVAAHDLQEPLRKVQSFGDLLNDQFSHELSDTALDLIRRMRLSANRMQTLVQDLLIYARLTTDLQPFKPVNLNILLDIVTDDMEFVITDMQAKLTIDPLPTVLGDGRQLQQLFQNLLSNALKFHRPGQQPNIQIRSRIATPTELPDTLLNRQQNRFAVVEITDNGIGFDEQYLDRIFAIFQRLHAQNQFVGTGIGLAICKKVADSHGGCIIARSQPGLGATFTVWLPLSEL
jgi:signal transduction histidine kinase